MNPLLVDSCKQTFNDTDEVTDSERPSTSSKNSPDVKSKSRMPFSYFSNESQIKNDFLNRYNEVYEDVLLDPKGIYLTKQLELEKDIFYQMIQKRPKIKTTQSYYSNLQTIVYELVKKYIDNYAANISSKVLSLICQKTSKTIFALYAALEQCYNSKTMLEMFSNSYHFPPKVLEFFKLQFPCLETLAPYKQEDFEILTSPFTPNHDDEVFMMKTFTDFVGLIRADKELGRLLAMLVMFSPSGVEMAPEETETLKQHQSQITIIMYNHILNTEKSNNTEAVRRLSDLVGIIDALGKCGHILTSSIIIPEDENEEQMLENITVDQL